MDLRQLQGSPAAFRAALVIDADGSPRRLGDVLDDWQAADFAALDNGWRRVAGLPPTGDSRTYGRAYLERPRGHSKTNDIAVSVSWALFASRRQLSGVVAAADKEQSGLIRNAVAKLVALNPWLGAILDVQRDRVVNRHTASELVILSCDAPSSYGLTPDFIIVDELTHWPKRDLWDSLFSAAAKRKNCLLLVIANAGFRDSWQWATREAVRQDPNWHFHRLDGPQASWIDAKLLDEQLRLLPPAAYARLWRNEWSDGAGDALEAADIEAAVNASLTPMQGNEAGYTFLAGLDLGVKHDHSALVVVGVSHAEQRFRLAECRSWAPGRNGKVSLPDVERVLLNLHARFRFRRVNYDPHQAILLAQRLTELRVPMREVPFSGKALTEMATTLLDVFRSRRIDLFDSPELVRDLRRLRITEKSYGFRLDATRDENGHCDLATALALALHNAETTAGRPPRMHVEAMLRASGDTQKLEELLMKIRSLPPKF